VQKALDQMNLRIHYVISDITGTTGLAIIDATTYGKRTEAQPTCGGSSILMVACSVTSMRAETGWS
jgi:hypothetical protein